MGQEASGGLWHPGMTILHIDRPFFCFDGPLGPGMGKLPLQPLSCSADESGDAVKRGKKLEGKDGCKKDRSFQF